MSRTPSASRPKERPRSNSRRSGVRAWKARPWARLSSGQCRSAWNSKRHRPANVGGSMARLQRRRFSESDDVRLIPHGKIDVVAMDDRVIGRMTYEPGWRWSVDVKPIAATQTCQFHHVGVTLSGRLRVQMEDGVELEIGPGEVFEIPPGHDAWVVGDEAWVSVDFEAMRAFARTQASPGRRVLSSILFTDIVDSTARAVTYGPARWGDMVGRHNEIAERVIDAHDGRLVKTTGDGVIGLFDSAERAVRAAAALGDAIGPLGISIRTAVWKCPEVQ